MKHILLLTFIVFLSIDCHSDNPSQTLTVTQVKNIAAYCKVWGFLKYYHPAVTDGNIDWDSVFIQIYPKIKNANSVNDFNDAIFELYSRADHALNDSGHILYSPDLGEEFAMIDFQWFDDHSIFSEKISKALHKTKDDFKPCYSHYVGAVSGGAGNSVFYMDNHFNENNPYPEESIRALTVSRFWNCINYFYPYKNIIGSSWDSALTRYLPNIITAKDTFTYQFSALEFYNSINDGHSFTNSKWVGNYIGIAYLPFALSDIEGKPVITRAFITKNSDSVLASIGVHKGDVILKIGGKNADSIRNAYLKYVPGSNPPGKMRNATSYLLRGNPNEEVTITITDGISTHTIATTYQTPPPRNSWLSKDRKGVWKILSGNIGYVDMGNLNPGQISEMMKDLEKTKAIVFDVRNYPHGTMYEVGKYLCKRKPFVYCTVPNIFKPGYFYKEPVMNETGEEEKYHGKITILADERTQSHAEFTVMALQVVPGAKTFGSQTAGADGNISTIPLPGGVSTVFTGLGIFYPDGTQTQRVGIKIDYEVKPTIKGIREGRDEVLERAIRYINTGQ